MAIGRPPGKLAAVAVGVYLLTAALWIDALPATSIEAFQHIQMSGIEEEEVRELWGTILCLIWSVCVWFYARSVESPSRIPGD